MSRLLRRSFVAGVAAMGVLSPLAAVPATAAETIKMIAIDGYPERSMWVKEFANFFIPRVNEELARTGKYEIDWQQAYGGQIVKPRGVLDGIKLGLGDIGIVTTIFHNSALPSQAVAAATPMVSTDARVVAKAVDEIAKEYPQMQAEFAAQDQVYLATGVVLDSYQIFTKTPVKTLDELSGLKLAGAGYNLRYLEGLKDVAGVRGGLPNFYNMLQTGVVDAAMLWPEAAMTFKIFEVAPYMLKVDLGAVNSKTVTVNKAVWDKLPDEVKDVLQTVAVEYRDQVANVAMDRAASSLDAFKEAGGTVVVVPEDQRSAWADAMPNIAQEWASALDKKGAPGTAMLGSYMEKLKTAGSVPVRDWAQ